MLVDEYEQFQNDKTDDVVVSQSGSDEPDAAPPADDCKRPPPTFDPLPAIATILCGGEGFSGHTPPRLRVAYDAGVAINWSLRMCSKICLYHSPDNDGSRPPQRP